LKTVYLLRHGKSSWDDPLLADHERPLAPRGRKAAGRMADRLHQAGPRPQMVLCSSAARARATLDAISRALGKAADVRIEDALYGASAEEILDRLRELPERVDAVLVIGHNPGLQDLALELAGDGDAACWSRLREKFPTAALATLSTSASWAELGPDQAYLESLVTP
jgi:phosphohistidine phosphatase